ncbi:GNAT family N-acetyltransferase [Aquimarina sp. 2201CG14-23]|uniref:GNAT family N-acetyltransferase n=1 Tax=Aquimarina mycalae TaxID=3040073 RepID=UPI002477E0C7|nr:GNAT family N-acetyltransferase [Aquimarina sp. 2201CG14-23]MDH7445773.1 GNAT family N-acetyltransferase [Aquimarina sp. 2201CG14-23]
MWTNYLEKRETERLLIRPLIDKDAAVWQEFIMDEVATKFFPDDWKMKPEKSKEWIDFQLNRYKEQRYGLQALIDKKSGEFVGQCGLLLQNIDDKNEIEVGYHLISRYQGNGYAIEAANEFKKLCFENNLATSVISIIDIDNVASQKVAERNGMIRGVRTTYMDMDVFVYRITLEHYTKLLDK